MKKIGVYVLFFMGMIAHGQTTSKEFISKRIIVTKDTIVIDSVSINPLRFKVLDAKTITIPEDQYTIDFGTATLSIDHIRYPEITVQYYRFPSFLTKTYSPYSKDIISPTTTNTGKLYSLTTNKKSSTIPIFDGLKTSGFITRGVTIGNNQNAVTNAALDLTIEGKLSKDVSIAGHIFDTNIPLQQNGYSQNITDFDRIFIELFSKNWRVKAGDVRLSNTDSYFLNFEKQVAGVAVEAALSDQFSVAASGAVVRGQFSAYTFVGVEGNQGPYKIVGPQNQAAIVIVAGSDRVYVNGTEIKRGEDFDYTIDYNLGELRFNTTYPITNDMRIRIEFQYSDRNYTRFITYEKASYANDQWSINGYFYNENDAKNSPLQLSLTDAQKQQLSQAGNNEDLMFSDAAFLDSFSNTKILYKKITTNTETYYEYTTEQASELYTLTFTNVGSGRGDYEVDRSIAIGTIFTYVGQQQGSYQPIIRLFAPTKLQVAALQSMYTPSDKMHITTEVALSANDQNLFSSIDNDQNNGIATKVAWKQRLLEGNWNLMSAVEHQFIHKNFATVQRFQAVEFNRDWNLFNAQGHQQQITATLDLNKGPQQKIKYAFTHLSFSENFKGNMHEFSSTNSINQTSFYSWARVLNNTSTLEDNSFIRAKAGIEQDLNSLWIGGFAALESNKRKRTDTNTFFNTSHQFNEYEGYIGIGDSTRVFAKLGVNLRTNDSIRGYQFTQINERKTFYVNSKLIQKKNTNLGVYANYRQTENSFADDEKTLNSKIVFNQRLFNNMVTLGTVYETASGNVARQDFVYIATEPGQGFYTWIDYNNNGIQDFDEFEIAEFQDQANFLRVPLPNLRYIATQRAQWNQSLGLNFSTWKTKKGFKKVLAHVQNQTFLAIDNEQERQQNQFNLNPFNTGNDNQIRLNYSFRNSLYINRNLQRHSVTYTFGNTNTKQQFFIGIQDNTSKTHELAFQHKFKKYWLVDVLTKVSENTLATENFASRNYNIESVEFAPKISYLVSNSNRFSAFYTYKNKENIASALESLDQHKLGVEYLKVSKKSNQLSLNLTAFFNDFNGNANSPVGYQMLEGLQEGKNYTWSALFSKKLSTIFNLNFNYFGRKSERSSTIHTGTIQLRAIF